MTLDSLQGSIADRITQLRQSLPATVQIVAVTKQVSVEAMRQAYAAGVRDFAESRIQEAEEKQEQLKDLADVSWHFIGHLQANKAQKALHLFAWIHSIDSLKLAQRLNRLSETLVQKPSLCLQVKLLPDPNKFGWTVSELITDIKELNECEHLNIRGFMMIPPAGLSEPELVQFFHQAQQFAETIRSQKFTRIDVQELSMGMSNDYAIAVKAGATMIRPGRILFGDRAN